MKGCASSIYRTTNGWTTRYTRGAESREVELPHGYYVEDGRLWDGCYYAVIEDEKGDPVFVFNDYMKKKL